MSHIISHVAQQRSFNAVQLVQSMGLEEIDSVMTIMDYATNKEYRLSSILFGKTVFVCIKEFLKKDVEIVIIGSVKMDSFISIRHYHKGKCISSTPVVDVEFGIVDLSNDGDRWEGMVYKEKPCGRGIIYDKNNCMIYHGYNYFGNNVGFGIEYYRNVVTPIPHYKGPYCFGVRHGFGQIFDKKNELIGTIGFMYGQPCEDQVITIPDKTEDILFHHTLMSAYLIGNGCYRHHTSFHLSNYPQLQKLTIGDDCFCEKSGKKQTFVVQSCPQLRRIEIGNRSFMHYERCTIQNLPLLEFCSFGSLCADCQSFRDCQFLCFQSCSWLIQSWIDLPKLQRIHMGDGCFTKQQWTQFESCLLLRVSS